MCRLAAHVDGTGDDRVEFSAPQCAHAYPQRGDPGEFLAGHGEAEPTKVSLRVDAVGRDVRHGSDHAIGGQPRGRVLVVGHPFVVGGMLHPQPMTWDGGVTSHADDYPGWLRVSADVLER